jgi:hypothetical protein
VEDDPEDLARKELVCVNMTSLCAAMSVETIVNLLLEKASGD